MKFKGLAAALSLLLLCGCSSIVSKKKYAVTIDTNPSQASFMLTNRAGLVVHSGTTPTSVVLKASAGFYKGETYTLTLNKQGFAEKVVTINSSLDPWYFGNILIVSFAGMFVVDPVTGAMFKLPDRSDTVLAPLQALNNVSIDALAENERTTLSPVQ